MRISRQIAVLCIGLIQYAVCCGDMYMVIDVSGGVDASEFPVSYLDKIPSGGWGDAFKTDKIVLAKVSLQASPFYIGVYEITQRQWELVTGKRPSYYQNDACYAKRPVEGVSYDDIRGSDKGAGFPKNKKVDDESFIGILRRKTKLKTIDLPTEKQWTVACDGAADGDATSGSVEMAEMGRFSVNPGF